MSRKETTNGQLGFDALLSDAETENWERRFARESDPVLLIDGSNLTGCQDFRDHLRVLQEISLIRN